MEKLLGAFCSLGNFSHSSLYFCFMSYKNIIFPPAPDEEAWLWFESDLLDMFNEWEIPEILKESLRQLGATFGC